MKTLIIYPPVDCLGGVRNRKLAMKIDTTDGGSLYRPMHKRTGARTAIRGLSSNDLYWSFFTDLKDVTTASGKVTVCRLWSWEFKMFELTIDRVTVPPRESLCALGSFHIYNGVFSAGIINHVGRRTHGSGRIHTWNRTHRGPLTHKQRTSML